MKFQAVSLLGLAATVSARSVGPRSDIPEPSVPESAYSSTPDVAFEIPEIKVVPYTSKFLENAFIDLYSETKDDVYYLAQVPFISLTGLVSKDKNPDVYQRVHDAAFRIAAAIDKTTAAINGASQEDLDLQKLTPEEETAANVAVNAIARDIASGQDTEEADSFKLPKIPGVPSIPGIPKIPGIPGLPNPITIITDLLKKYLPLAKLRVSLKKFLRFLAWATPLASIITALTILVLAIPVAFLIAFALAPLLGPFAPLAFLLVIILPILFFAEAAAVIAIGKSLTELFNALANKIPDAKALAVSYNSFFRTINVQ